MAVLVFLGVYTLGNPVDLLINPESDQQEIEAARNLGQDAVRLPDRLDHGAAAQRVDVRYAVGRVVACIIEKAVP